MLDIVDSIIAFEAEPQLGGCTSMTDLIITSRPISSPPMDVVSVGHLAGFVTIEHATHTGHNDRLERPARDAVALF